MNHRYSRRETLKTAAAFGAGTAMFSPTAHADEPLGQKQMTSVRYCLNTSTIRGHELDIEQKIDLIAEAGYGAVELWINEITKFKESGGKLSDLKKRMNDQGLTLESAIGFANWIVDDEAERQKGLRTLQRDMELVRELGGHRIAAPPAGATKDSLDLRQAAARYRAALEIGEQTGVQPQLELWGFSTTLSRLGELAYVAAESGREDARLLLDVYHIYKGGSPFSGLSLIDGSAVEVLHMNDYPDIANDQIGDADRVYPGDGIAPITAILRTLFNNGFQGILSLELFNPTYWKDDVRAVLKKGLVSMQHSVHTALHEG